MATFIETPVVRTFNLQPAAPVVTPTLPDGSVARLEVDDTACQKHNLSIHGWPANAIQEYMNNENLKIQEMLLGKLKVMANVNNPDVALNDAQKASLAFPKYAQTFTEFEVAANKLASLRESYLKKPDVNDGSDGNSIKFDKSDSDKSDD